MFLVIFSPDICAEVIMTLDFLKEKGNRRRTPGLPESDVRTQALFSVQREPGALEKDVEPGARGAHKLGWGSLLFLFLLCFFFLPLNPEKTI